MEQADVLIIMDGGLGGAIACAMECERGLEVVAWQTPPGGGLSGAALRGVDHERAGALVREQADLFGAHETVLCEDVTGQGIDASAMLFEAAKGGVARGVTRVIWPRACGEDIDAMFRISERADLVGRLVMLDAADATGADLRIETPFVDLTGEQLASVAQDLEIPDGIWAGRFVVGSKVA